MTQAQAKSEELDGKTINLTRRKALKGLAAGTGAAAVGVGADHATLAPVEHARAYGEVTGALKRGAESIVGLFTGGSKEKTAEEATKDATNDDLKTDLYRVALKRESDNASRFLDTEDIADLSRDTAYEQGKIAAFGPLQDGKTEQEVVDAAQNAVTEYFATPKKDILDQWNESVTELMNYVGEIENQGFSLDSFFDAPKLENPDAYDDLGIKDMRTETKTVSLPNGQSIKVNRVLAQKALGNRDSDWTSTRVWDPTETTEYNSFGEDKYVIDNPGFITAHGPNDSVKYLLFNDWNNIWSKINTIEDEVKSGLSEWVNTVYGNLQAGEITIQDVASNLDLAQRALEDEGIPRAKADLLAMNLPTDLDREVTVSYTESGVEWTASGLFAALGSTTPTWEAGKTYDTSTDGVPRCIIATDGDSVSGIWSGFNAAVDGGIIEFTSEPIIDTVYQINTKAGETASVEYTAFPSTSDPENGVWTTDLSDQLDDPITEVESVKVYPQTTDDYQVVLDGQFTIESITDQETGEEVDQAETAREKEPQRDDNYITADEWEQLRKDREEQYDRLEELFKEVENSGGGGGLFGGGNWLPTLPGLGVIESAVVVGLGFLGINALSS